MNIKKPISPLKKRLKLNIKKIIINSNKKKIINIPYFLGRKFTKIYKVLLIIITFYKKRKIQGNTHL